MESTRYFEFAFMWRSLRDVQTKTYLDVSSPRLFPLLLLRDKTDATATLMNPDADDLADTAGLAAALGLRDRCTLESAPIESAQLAKDHFDVVTSMSVLEHIEDDTAAVRRIWEVLKPGGRLLLSMPCAAIAERQLINVSVYGFLKPDADGYFFHQYLYDDRRLQERIFSVTGSPASFEVYGEKMPGTHRVAYERKWTDGTYPFWKEPWHMAVQFQRYASIASLPGEGVVLLEFVK
jgi:SAM-dependent methyltransferase